MSYHKNIPPIVVQIDYTVETKTQVQKIDPFKYFSLARLRIIHDGRTEVVRAPGSIHDFEIPYNGFIPSSFDECLIMAKVLGIKNPQQISCFFGSKIE